MHTNLIYCILFTLIYLLLKAMLREVCIVLVVVIYGLLLPSFLFVYCLADVRNKGWLGTISRFVIIRFPRYLKRFVASLCGRSVYQCLADTLNYSLHERNPILQITYLLLINGAFLIWLVKGYPRIPTFLVSHFHANLVFFLLFICHLSFIKACSRSPGVITPQNVNCFMHTPYDGVLFKEGNLCRTCHVIKPARSKHCNMCGVCVPRFDHHCGNIPFKQHISTVALNT